MWTLKITLCNNRMETGSEKEASSDGDCPAEGMQCRRCRTHVDRRGGGDRKERHPGNMLIPGGIPRSMHAVPERRSNEGGGWGGVTPCVVSPPHRLPTKRATLAPKNDRLLASRGCHGERHHGPVRLSSLPGRSEDARTRPCRHVAERIKP